MVDITFVGVDLKCQTKPDLFSPKGLDQGTRLLLQQLAKRQYQMALDWGCGWGAIGLFLAARNPQAKIWAVDANVGAVKTTQDNATSNKINNLTVMASDSFSELDPTQQFDLIATNPPTHQGREVVDAMIADSHGRLCDGGALMVVVEARLKPWVVRDLQQTFGNYKILDRGPKNVVLTATKTV